MKKHRTGYDLLFILFVCIAFVIIGCSAAETPENIPQYNMDDDVDIDFQGYDFVYLLNDRADDNIFLTYEEGTNFADAARKRIREKEKEYNFNFVERFTDSSDGTISFLLAAGDSSVSAMQWSKYNDNLQSCIHAGYFQPYDILMYLDYTDEEKWGYSYLREGLCWNDSTYGLIPLKWPEFNLCYVEFLLAVNMDKVASLGMCDPREYLDSGAWTRKKLEEVTKDYTYTDANGNTVYGLAANYYHFIISVINSSVNDILVENGDSYTLAPYTNEGIDALNWGNDFMYRTCKEYMLPDITDTEPLIQAFIDLKSTMLCMNSSYIYQTTTQFLEDSIAYCGMNYIVMPFPRSATDGTLPWKCMFEMVRHCITMPVNTKEPEAAAFILDSLYDSLDGFNEEELKEYYLRNVFYDEKEYNLFFDLLKTTRYVYRGEGLGPIYAEFGHCNTKTVAQMLESYEDQVDKIISDYIVNMRNSFKTCFGK